MSLPAVNIPVLSVPKGSHAMHQCPRCGSHYGGAYCPNPACLQPARSPYKEGPACLNKDSECCHKSCHGRDGKDGCDGRDGKDGCDGKDGHHGKDGCDGKDGRPGPPGPPGKDGCDGKDGQDGDCGLCGKDGVCGQDGKDGCDGRDGRDGCDGKDGLPGKDGKDGCDGRPGHDGKDGCDGLPGKDGCNGKDGRDGRHGKDGCAGPKGDCCDAKKPGCMYVDCSKGKDESCVPEYASRPCKSIGYALANCPSGYKLMLGAGKYDAVKSLCEQPHELAYSGQGMATYLQGCTVAGQPNYYYSKLKMDYLNVDGKEAKVTCNRATIGAGDYSVRLYGESSETRYEKSEFASNQYPITVEEGYHKITIDGCKYNGNKPWVLVRPGAQAEIHVVDTMMKTPAVENQGGKASLWAASSAMMTPAAIGSEVEMTMVPTPPMEVAPVPSKPASAAAGTKPAPVPIPVITNSAGPALPVVNNRTLILDACSNAINTIPATVDHLLIFRSSSKHPVSKFSLQLPVGAPDSHEICIKNSSGSDVVVHGPSFNAVPMQSKEAPSKLNLESGKVARLVYYDAVKSWHRV